MTLPPRADRRRAAAGALAGTVLAVAALVGCSSAGSNPPTGSATPTGSPVTSTLVTTVGVTTVGTTTRTATVQETVTSRAPGSQVLAEPPAATSTPAPVDGPCPYLTDDEVADINGQRTGQTSVTDVQPYPICTFTRSDGGWLATVRFIAADTPQAAVAAVDQHVPIDGSDPASQPTGWAGGAMVQGDRSVYAVAKGPLAVVAESNQLQTVKGRQMVVTAVGRLGL